MSETIEYYTSSGWQQSHTATDKGCIFERLDDCLLNVIATNSKGVILTRMTFDQFAIDNGIAGNAVNALYSAINK